MANATMIAAVAAGGAIGAYVTAPVLLSLLAFGAGFWADRHSGKWQ